MSTGFLTSLRDQIAAYLQTRADLGGVSVVTKVTGNIQSEIDQAIARMGAFVFIPTPLPTDTNPNVPALWWNRIEITIVVGEQPTMNATGMDACLLAENIIRHLKAWRPTDLPGCDLIYPAPRCIQEIHEAKAPSLQLYQLNLITKGGQPAL